MSDGVFRKRPDGFWEPAIPLPYLYSLGVRCHCGHWFFGRRAKARARYEEHYRQHHLVEKNFEGHDPAQREQHRTVGPHHCEWCYPDEPCGCFGPS